MAIVRPVAARTAPVLGTLLVGLASSLACAGGVVGHGTPDSCTAAAFDSARVGGGLITFNCGPGPVNIELTGERGVALDTRIDGGDTIGLMGDGASRLFRVGPGVTFELNRLSLVRGKGGHGGAIYNDRGALRITGCSFVDNQASGGRYGGAIYSYLGTVTIRGTIFEANSATFGSAIYLHTTGARIAKSVFIDNKAATGGGALEINKGSLVLERSILRRNASDRYAGAVYIYSNAEVDILASVFTDNLATTVSTSNYGGAIYNYGGSLRVRYSTIYRNGSRLGAAGIQHGNGVTTVLGSIVAGSVSGRDCVGAIASNGRNLSGDLSCPFTRATDFRGVDPKLAGAGFPRPGSPVINAGHPSCPSPDVGGVQRPLGSACEIGAFERP